MKLALRDRDVYSFIFKKYTPCGGTPEQRAEHLANWLLEQSNIPSITVDATMNLAVASSEGTLKQTDDAYGIILSHIEEPNSICRVKHRDGDVFYIRDRYSGVCHVTIIDLDLNNMKENHIVWRVVEDYEVGDVLEMFKCDSNNILTKIKEA